MLVRTVAALASLCGLALCAPAPRSDSILSKRDVSTCPGYTASGPNPAGKSAVKYDLNLAGPHCDVYNEDLEELTLLVEYQADDRLHLHIYDQGENMYQVQDEAFSRPGSDEISPEKHLLEVKVTQEPFSFQIIRKENGDVLFDTTGNKLIFESQYIGLRTNLPNSPNLYGFGEHSDPLRFPTDNYHRTFWNSEAPGLPTNSNLYGSHPVYFDHRGSKGTHGVFLLNANGMDVNIAKTGDKQYLEYNILGGTLDFYFLAGDKPSDVSRQYADVVGYSAMYPYWAFGFQQCRYGYGDVNEVAEVVGNYSTAGIPLEVMWTDIDYMDHRWDFTLDPERFPLHKMRELVTTLHDRHQKYILILDPAIKNDPSYGPYKRGHDQGIFLKNADGSDYLGVQWAGIAAWPDWFNEDTAQWWSSEIDTFFDAATGVDVDGLWVDMNEASNFCPNSTCDLKAVAAANVPPAGIDPRPNTGRPIPGFPADFQPTSSNVSGLHSRSPRLQTREWVSGQKKGMPRRNVLDPAYKIHNQINSNTGLLSDKTIYTDKMNSDGTIQYDTHNLYGHMMSRATQKALADRRPGKRPFVMTRSTFASTGRKATHWFGDNASTWEHYRLSIRQMVAFVSMHQMPMVGSDVCGFNEHADKDMCARWAMLGAFQPFYRNHAEIHTRHQEFYQWPETIKAAKKAIDTRYKLLDYAYTGLHFQTEDGDPWIKPLFFLYPEDANTFAVQDQWFYGDALLISPVIQDFSDTVTFYLPDDIFYDYWTGEQVIGQGANKTISGLGTDEIPVHIRGGSIIPERVNSANTTKLLREQDFLFRIAPDGDGNAWGTLYIDDGESIDQPSVTVLDLTFKDGKLSVSGKFEYQPAEGESVSVEKIIVLGEKSSETKGPWKLDKAFTATIDS